MKKPLVPVAMAQVPSRFGNGRAGRMLAKIIVEAAVIIPGIESCMSQERISIASDWGEVAADLIDNEAARALVRMLPLTIEMSDHMRQEKTGNLPASLPETRRQRDFSTGTLALWSSNHFVIYYRSGRVPLPGIIVLGRVTGDVSIFDRPGPVTVRIELAETNGPRIGSTA